MGDKLDKAFAEADEIEAMDRAGVTHSMIGSTITRWGRSFRVEWSEEDQEYVGLANDFASLSWLAGTEDEALSGIMRLVRDIDKGRA